MRPTAQSQGELVAWGRYQTHLGCKLQVPYQHGLPVDLSPSCKHWFMTPQETGLANHQRVERSQDS